ncbi:MAG: FliH/SctL family protein [Alphaproteobacteria bacterium]|nr:FliH/SctL family protein [Alphaproteobacteria bacterium]
MNETAPQRFMFGTSFDPEAIKAAQEQKAPPVFSEEEVALAKEQSYGQGYVAGKEAAMREMQNQQNELLAHIQLLFERMANEVWKLAAQNKQAAAEIGLAIARKIVPDFVRRSGVQEMVAAVEASVIDMINEPRMVLRICEAQFDDMNKEMSALTARVGYAGKMIILADNTLEANDCRLEWADGGMERSVNLTWSEIERQMQIHKTTGHQSHVEYAQPVTDAPHQTPPTTNIAV